MGLWAGTPQICVSPPPQFFCARARFLSAGLRYLRLTRLPRHDAAPYPGGIDPRLAVHARSWDGHHTTTRRDRLPLPAVGRHGLLLLLLRQEAPRVHVLLQEGSLARSHYPPFAADPPPSWTWLQSSPNGALCVPVRTICAPRSWRVRRVSFNTATRWKAQGAGQKKRDGTAATQYVGAETCCFGV